MSIWKHDPVLEVLNKQNKNTLCEQLGMEFTEIGEDYLKARMPVDGRTRQPLGLLHGGASVALAETLGSCAAALCIDLMSQQPVGLEINANHIRAVRDGYVEGVARPLHIGRSTHVWEIKIHNQEDKLVCVSRITMAIIDRRK